MNLYFCVGCRQVHYDDDYNENDGDLIIYNHKEFFKSVDGIKKLFAKKCVKKGDEVK